MPQFSPLERVFKAGLDVIVSLPLLVAEHVGTAYESGMLSQDLIEHIVHREKTGLVIFWYVRPLGR